MAPPTARTNPDLIDQVTAALAKPDTDPEHQKFAAWLDDQIAKLIAERGADRPRNIIEALVEAMRLVSHVGKDSRNEQGRGYSFRGIDAVLNALGPALRQVGVLVMPRMQSYAYGEVTVGRERTLQAHVKAEVRYDFLYSNADGEISETYALVPAEAMDSGDKATSKAMSVAMRIALLQTFSLPTTEPDPDHYTYERSDAPTTTNADVYAAVSWAASMSDLDAAFTQVRERFGADLFSLTLQNRAGEEVRGDKYLDQAEQQVREHRARQIAQAQDAHAEGATRDVADEPAEDAQPAQERAQTDDARAHETPPPADNPPTTPPAARAPQAGPARAETRAEKQKRLAIEELTFQAEALGKPYGEYISPIVGDDGTLETWRAPVGIRFIMNQRATVIAALRDQGRATHADAYERIGDAFPVLMEQIIDAEEFVREKVTTT